MPEPIGSDSLISTTHESFYIIYTKSGVEFFRASASAKPNFPINSKYILKTTEEQEIHHALFQLHPEHGVSVFITYQEKEQVMYRWYSIHGKPLTEPKPVSLPPFLEIIEVNANKEAWILRTSENVLYYTNKQTQILPQSISYAIGKDGPMIFSQGNLQRFKPK